MPADGQIGTAADGTPVVWRAALGRAVPVSQAKAMGWKPPTDPNAPMKESQEDKKRVSDMGTALGDMNLAATSAEDFLKRNQRTGTGGIYGVPFVSDVAKALPWTSKDLGAMDRDSVTIANRLRPPGMRMTQMEFMKFLGASPSTGLPGDKNVENVGSIRKAHVLATAQSAFYDKWLEKRGNLHGADAAFQDYMGRYFSPDGTYTGGDRDAKNNALKDMSGRPRLLGMEKP